MLELQDAIGLMRKRMSCRTYDGKPIAAESQQQLGAFLGRVSAGPFGATTRLALIAATREDRAAVRRLGTYGFIKGSTAYVVGAVSEAARIGVLEDFGYTMERVVLYATQLGLGTVWLGGTFTKSRFVRAMGLHEGESLPAVVATGNVARRARSADAVIRRGAQADKRLPWEQLFCMTPAEGRGLFEVPLPHRDARAYAEALEMVRLAPSASNKQPWRVVCGDGAWHFYLRRSHGYRSRNALVGVADMQRIDMGIAMCHFELAMRQLAMAGRWMFEDPGFALPDPLTSYVATWVAA